MDDDARMGWILVLMVVVPAVAFGGLAVYAASRAAERNRLISGSPRAAKLLARAERALGGIEHSAGLRGLPPTTSREVVAQARELVATALPELLARHGQLRMRVEAYEPGGDADRQRALEELAGKLASTDQALETLVGTLETLDAQLAGAEALPGEQALARSKGLVDRLHLIEESCRELEEEKKCLDP